MSRTRKYTDEEIIKALRKTKGMVYLAAEQIGCAADTIYHRSKQSDRILEAMRTERGKVVDTAESKLFTAIENGEPWAIRMALCTIGKARGYVERMEFKGSMSMNWDDLLEGVPDGPEPDTVEEEITRALGDK